ncbi:MAG: flagellar cap protein [Gammaproteobacteria bacterium]|nr:MAG: flagellar cap protein [Gammaproteobacteria bacterium]
MAITAAGVGSGLDIETIVYQLMTIERQPLDQLRQKEKEAEAEISAYGSLKSVLSTFQDAMANLSNADKFRVFTTTSSDEGVVTATTDSAAAAGTYNIDVTRLAQHHKLGSTALADTTSVGGTAGDSLTITVDGNATTIDLSAAKTLSQVRDAINTAADNPGVTATLLSKGDGTSHLILTSDESGYAKRIQLSYGGSITDTTFGFSVLNQDTSGVTLTDLTQLDAAYSVDGIGLTSASNSVTSVLDGLTLQLEGVGSSVLEVARDDAAIEESAKAFVDGYNEVLKKIDELKTGALEGDGSLRRIVSQFRDAINSPASGLTGSFTSLTQVGIRTNGKTGELEFDSATFSDALAQDFASLSELFANATDGYAVRFENVAKALTDTDGMLDLRTSSLNDRVRTLQDRQSDMEYQLQLKEKAMRAKYAALDSLVGNLQSIGSFLTSQLSSLPR